MTTWRLLPMLLTLLALVAAGCGAEEQPKEDDGGGKRSGGFAADHPGRSFERDARELGCMVEHPEQQEGEHLGEGERLELSHEPYSSDPPTSGPHYGLVTRYGFYDEPVADEYVVHNLEHGAVAVWYGGDPGDWRSIARSLFDRSPEVVVAPREELDGDAVAAAAWGALLRCDADAVRAAGRDRVGALLVQWVGRMVDAPAAQEAQVGAVYAGTRQRLDAYEEGGVRFARLPAQPRPEIDTTVEG